VQGRLIDPLCLPLSPHLVSMHSPPGPGLILKLSLTSSLSPELMGGQAVLGGYWMESDGRGVSLSQGELGEFFYTIFVGRSKEGLVESINRTLT
jgi:hypothetical protein